jgi:hypothetical protein
MSSGLALERSCARRSAQTDASSGVSPNPMQALRHAGAADLESSGRRTRPAFGTCTMAAATRRKMKTR